MYTLGCLNACADKLNDIDYDRSAALKLVDSRVCVFIAHRLVDDELLLCSRGKCGNVLLATLPRTSSRGLLLFFGFVVVIVLDLALVFVVFDLCRTDKS